MDARLRQALEEHVPGCHPVRLLPGGTANLVVHLVKGSENLIFRLYLADDIPRFDYERRTLLRLTEIGAPTPRIVDWGRRAAGYRTPYITLKMLPGVTLAEAATRLPPNEVAKAVRTVAETAVTVAAALPVQAFGYLHTAVPRAINMPEVPHDVDAYAVVISRHGLVPHGELNAAVRAVRAGWHLVETDAPCLVHPDLKPENVLVSGSEVFLIDWELPIGGHPVLGLGGLLAEGCCLPPLRDALSAYLESLAAPQRAAAVTAGLLRGLEALSYLPTHPTAVDGRKVRRGARELGHSLAMLTEWMPE
jgi:aminoglycoside phosphotransferase (APT) family kinase protein